MDNEKQTHPSFGVVNLAKWQSSQSQTFFGSDLQHNHGITLSISRAELKRDIAHDWIFGREVLVSVDMTYTQFTEMIASFNEGSGVPVTIRQTETERNIPLPEFQSKRDLFEKDFNSINNEFLKKIDDIVEEAKNRNYPKIFVQQLEVLRLHMESNVPYVADQFTKCMDRAVADAKNEIEAYADTTIHRLGMEKLAELNDCSKPMPKLIESNKDKTNANA